MILPGSRLTITSSVILF